MNVHGHNDQTISIVLHSCVFMYGQRLPSTVSTVSTPTSLVVLVGGSGLVVASSDSSIFSSPVISRRLTDTIINKERIIILMETEWDKWHDPNTC